MPIEFPESTPTRSRILEAARRLFYEPGVNATGISTILRDAGVNSGSLYHHFESKDALLLGVLQNYIEMLQPAVMVHAEQATTDPIERVFALFDLYRRGILTTDFRMGCPIGNLALEIADDNPEARALIDQNFRNWMAVVRGWLDLAADRLPDSVDRAELATLILTVMEGGLMQARAARSIEPYDASVAQVQSYLELLMRIRREEPARA